MRAGVAASADATTSSTTRSGKTPPTSRDGVCGPPRCGAGVHHQRDLVARIGPSTRPTPKRQRDKLGKAGSASGPGSDVALKSGNRMVIARVEEDLRLPVCPLLDGGADIAVDPATDPVPEPVGW
jgi:hypothetical protein